MMDSNLLLDTSNSSLATSYSPLELVAHNEFKNLKFNEHQMVLDFCGVRK